MTNRTVRVALSVVWWGADVAFPVMHQARIIHAVLWSNGRDLIMSLP